MRINKKILISTLVLLVLLSFSLFVQGKSPYTIFPGTIESMELNPAKLGVSDNIVELQLNPISLSVWNNTLTPYYVLDNINAYLDDAKKEELLSFMTGDAFSIGVDLSTGAFLGGGSWGLRTKLEADVQLDLAQDIFEFILKGSGLDPNFAIDLSNTGANVNTTLNTGLSIAFPLKKVADNFRWESLHLGAGVNYLNGLVYIDADTDLKGEILDNGEEIKIDGDIKLLYSMTPFLTKLLATGDGEFFDELPQDEGGGQGISYDFGIWAQPSTKLGFGLSLLNFGSMEWSGVRYSQFKGDITMKYPLDEDLEEREEWIEENLEEEIINAAHDNIIVDTPYSVQASVNYQLFSRLHLAGALGYHQGAVPYNSLTLGTRLYLPRWIPLTFVVDYDTYQQVASLSAQLGFHIKGLEFINISLSDLTLATTGQAKEASLAISTAIRF